MKKSRRWHCPGLCGEDRASMKRRATRFIKTIYFLLKLVIVLRLCCVFPPTTPFSCALGNPVHCFTSLTAVSGRNFVEGNFSAKEQTREESKPR
jgi:hypothetical protein